MIARTSGRRSNTRHLDVPPADIKASRCSADSQHRVGADAPQRHDGGNHPLWRAARRHSLDHLEMIERACRTILALIFTNLSRRVVSAPSLAPSGSDVVWMKLARLSATRAIAAKRHWRRSVGRTTGSRRRHYCNSRRTALPRSDGWKTPSPARPGALCPPRVRLGRSQQQQSVLLRRWDAWVDQNGLTK